LPALTVGVFAPDPDQAMGAAASLAEAGPATDLALFQRTVEERTFTYVVPKAFPERIQPLMEALGMADAAILVASRLDPAFGELVVGLGLRGIPGILGLVPGDHVERARSLVRPYLKGWKEIELPDPREAGALQSHLLKFAPRVAEGPGELDVDHAMELKGKGTVALGVVRRGTLHPGEKVIAQPLGRDFQVRAIEFAGAQVPKAIPGTHVTLVLKGATAADLPRGTVLTTDPKLGKAGEFALRLSPHPLFKEPVGPGRTYVLSSALQVRTVAISGEPPNLVARTSDPLVFREYDPAMLALAHPPGKLRIVGQGTLHPSLH